MGSEEGSEIYVNIKISEETKEDPCTNYWRCFDPSFLRPWSYIVEYSWWYKKSVTSSNVSNLFVLICGILDKHVVCQGSYAFPNSWYQQGGRNYVEYQQIWKEKTSIQQSSKLLDSLSLTKEKKHKSASSCVVFFRDFIAQ